MARVPSVRDQECYRKMWIYYMRRSKSALIIFSAEFFMGTTLVANSDCTK